MPFTISHAAAALPFRRTRLIMSALVIGCFGPDLEYFLMLRPHGHIGHTLPGLILFDLPAGLAALFLFHWLAKGPLVGCLPVHLRERIRNGGKLRIGSISKFVLVCVSILVGSTTHIVWDSFTHNTYWLGHHWPLLRENVRVPMFGLRDWAAIFQYVSSVFGIVVILLWFIYWYRNTPPNHLEKDSGLFSRDRMVVGGAFVAAILVGLVRAAMVGLPHGVHGIQRFLTDASIAGITTFCVEILVYGFVHNRLSRESEAA
jgi:hypothetical protein